MYYCRFTKLPCHIIFIHHSSWFRGKYLACRDETMVSLLIGTLVWDANAACQEDQDHIVPVTYLLTSLFAFIVQCIHYILADFAWFLCKKTSLPSSCAAPAMSPNALCMNHVLPTELKVSVFQFPGNSWKTILHSIYVLSSKSDQLDWSTRKF